MFVWVNVGTPTGCGLVCQLRSEEKKKSKVFNVPPGVWFITDERQIVGGLFKKNLQRKGMVAMVALCIYGFIHLRGSKCMNKPANRTVAIFSTVSFLFMFVALFFFFYINSLQHMRLCLRYWLCHNVISIWITLLAPPQPTVLLEASTSLWVSFLWTKQPSLYSCTQRTFQTF